MCAGHSLYALRVLRFASCGVGVWGVGGERQDGGFRIPIIIIIAPKRIKGAAESGVSRSLRSHQPKMKIIGCGCAFLFLKATRIYEYEYGIWVL